jgi:ectoine hydroxylase-related dioxygenase (phytanoyl-CoA dioxygenase family)
MEAVRQRGYWFRRGLLNGEQVSTLAADVTAICDRRGWMVGRRGFAWDAPEFAQLQVEAQMLPQFAELREDPRLLNAAARLLGGPARAQQGDVCRVLFPHAPEFTTPPHQDQYFFKRTDEFWAAWIPLGDCSRDQGSLAVVSGSRRWGVLPHHESVCQLPSGGSRWREFDFRAGDVLFVHSLTVHKSLANRSRQLRISIDCRYSAVA